jgi:hypothetical protein
VWLIVTNLSLLTALLDARWLIAIFIEGPILATMSVVFTLMVSSGVSDPRVAEQISISAARSILHFDYRTCAGNLMIYLIVPIFQRESILTQWR